MSVRRRIKIDRIREELSCPQCGYSLRGVPGDVATCPECGTACDLTRLIVNRWTAPWYHAPKFHQVLAPLTWVALGAWVVVVALVFEMLLERTPWIAAGAAGVLGLVWAWLLWRLRDLMLDGAAMGLALLAHAIFAGYVVSLVGAIWVLWRVVSSGSLLLAPLVLAALLPLAALAWLCRRGEKYIAARCIRQYLVEAAKPGRKGEMSRES